MNYYNSYLKPSCEILINGQKRKLYGKSKNKIYLNDGDEFQLSVYNPLSERVGLQLKMNGVDVDNSMLVINPGQSVIVERFIGTNRKLKFSTYLVDKNNPQTKQAIKENGRLEITFWNEYKIQPYVNPVQPWVINTNPWTYPQPGTTPYVPPTWPIYYCGDDLKSPNYCGDDLKSPNTNTGYGGGTTTSNLNSQNITYTSGVDILGDLNVKGNLKVSGNIGIGTTPNPSHNLDMSRGLSETGRIEKGNRSNQHFTSTEFTAGSIIQTYVFKLLPFSEKNEPVVQAPYQQGTFQHQNNPYIIPNTNTNLFNSTSYVKSEGREYCPNKRCNYRIRKNNWAYCPICGTQIS